MSYGLYKSKVDLYDRTYQEVKGKVRPGSLKVGESRARVISPSRGFLGGFDYTMQLQVGCPGGCLFCYVPNSPRLAPSDIRNRWGFEVREKFDPLTRFARHLSRGTLAGKKIYWSAVTDPYAVRASVTRGIWETLLDAPAELRPERIVVQSRFRVDRDRKFIARYIDSARAADRLIPVLVSHTIGTDRNDLIYSWERATPDYEQRMSALLSLRKAGIPVVPSLSPFSLWNDLGLTLDRFRDMDIRKISVIFLKEKESTANTPEAFLKYIRKHYPCLLEKSWQEEQLAFMTSRMGEGNVLVGQKGFACLAEGAEFQANMSRYFLSGN